VKRQPPASIEEALQQPTVTLQELSAVTGFSYSTLLTDVHGGHLRAKRRPWKKRTRITVPREETLRYLRSLGFKIVTLPPA
jgi:lambda repressor-like predicted transcriptional regulator